MQDFTATVRINAKQKQTTRRISGRDALRQRESQRTQRKIGYSDEEKYTAK